MKIPEIPVDYYYIPPCPECGSKRTGRYMREPSIPFLEGRDGKEYTVKQCLKRGELVRFVPRRVPENNVFCADCGHEWKYDVRMSIVPRSRIEEEIRERGTIEAYEEYRNENPKRNKTIFGKICGFLP